MANTSSLRLGLCCEKRKIQDQIISSDQVSTCRIANQRLTAQCVQRTTVDMSL
jgi:hypothetical protein